jgi:hypothetical protein
MSFWKLGSITQKTARVKSWNVVLTSAERRAPGAQDEFEVYGAYLPLQPITGFLG